jgi:hypothetical protein
MANLGHGFELDKTFLAGAKMRTSTMSGGNGTMQYRVVGFAPGTTTQTDLLVDLAGGTSTLAEPTAPAAYAIGINQTHMSANSQECNVRMFGISKAVCAESIGAGMPVTAYGAIGAAASTTTMAGRIVQVDNAVTCTAYGMTLTSQFYVLGRALENGSTGTVIEILVNPQLYDRQIAGSIATT